MRPALKTAAAIAGLAAVAVTLFVVLVVAFFDWGSLREPIERAVAARTGRELAIGGEVAVDLGWRIEIVLNDVRLSNPDWARRPNLLEARRVTVTASLPALLVGRPKLHEVTLEQAKLALERHDGEGTWALGREDTGRVPEIGRLRIDDGSIEYLDRAGKTEIVAQVGAAGREALDDMKVSAKGTLRGAPFSLDASGPTVLLLADPAVGYPLEATVRAGATSARVSGTVFALAALRALDLAVEVEGQDLAGLRTLLGISLASSPPYKLRGRLRRGEAGWRFDDITGRIGDSDVAGALSYASAPRPHLEMKILSERLDFDDLGPLIGAPPKTTAGETASPEQRRKARAMSEAGQALPDKRFAANWWRGMDVDVSLVGRKVVHPPALPIQSLDARLRIRDGVLRLEPLTLQAAGGQVVATVELDGRDEPVRGVASVEFRGLRLRELFPTVEPMKKARGVAHGRARLAGNGASVAELLGSADGRVSLAVDRGSISNLVLELLGLDAGESILLFATGDRNIALRCAVADLDVRNGVATSNVLVLDTADTLVVGAGVIDLRRERLDLTLYPRPKDVSVLTARSPLRVRGTLRDPQVTPDARSLATRGATAALLALVNPLLALAPFIETGPGEDSDCARLLRQAKTWTNPAAPRDPATAVKLGTRP